MLSRVVFTCLTRSYDVLNRVVQRSEKKDDDDDDDTQHAMYLQKKTRRICSMNIVYVRDEEYLLLFEPLDVTCAFDVIRTTFSSLAMTFFVETFFVRASRRESERMFCSITNLSRRGDAHV